MSGTKSDDQPRNITNHATSHASGSAPRGKTALLILVPTFPWVNPNLDVLLGALPCSGVDFALAASDQLRLVNGEVQAPDSDGNFLALNDYTLVWLLGFGSRHSFLDKLQLLKLTASHVRFVNSPDAFVYLHAKYHLTSYLGRLQHPETHASHDAAWLYERLADGEQWIAKPPASSFGRGVFRISSRDPNARAILEELTDYGRGGYCLLQRYVPEIALGEKRVLLAAGEVLGAYLREPGSSGVTNLSAGGRAVRCTLDPQEYAACLELAVTLAQRGVNYAGIDLVYPWLIEINVANPGGLATLHELGDVDTARRLVQRLTVLLS